jgi:hypothetical protein
MAVAARAGLVNTETGEIVRFANNIEVNEGTAHNRKWLPVVRQTVGNPVTPFVKASAPVILPLTLPITNSSEIIEQITLADKTQGELDAEKLEMVTADLGNTPAGRAIHQAYEAIFSLARLHFPNLTLQQFRDTVEPLDNIPDGPFFDWVRDKLS